MWSGSESDSTPTTAQANSSASASASPSPAATSATAYAYVVCNVVVEGTRMNYNCGKQAPRIGTEIRNFREESNNSLTQSALAKMDKS